MRVAVFDTHRFERSTLEEALLAPLSSPTGSTAVPAAAAVQPGSKGSEPSVSWVFLEARLSVETVALARGCDAVSVFVNDRVHAPVLEELARMGVRAVALRCAGFNNVDLACARRLGIAVVRVPEYSPHAVAEHAVGLILALNRKLVRAAGRVKDGNFALDGLVGFDLYGKTVGVVGTGRIGAAFARIMKGFGCRLLAFDQVRDEALVAETGIEYAPLPRLLAEADIVSLHIPLNESTRHLMDGKALAAMKPGAMLINTGRGALVETEALVEALKEGRLGSAGLDVYEEEEGVFFADHSGEVLSDEKLTWLLMCPNVLITAHQAFLTQEALHAIARTTVESLRLIARQIAGVAPVAEADQRTILAPLRA